MKKKLLLTVLILSHFGLTAMSAELHEVTRDNALTIAQRQFQGQDVDYYISSNTAAQVWRIFVDAEPMKGWQHDCYVLTIPKQTTAPINLVIAEKESRKMPPLGDFEPLLVRNRYGNSANSKPKVSMNTLSNADSEAAQRTYAIILSGGYDRTSNHERYWNDCSFIYQTLVNRYGVPKDQVYPIMSDGNNPGLDMILTTGTLRSQPLDLDNDGIDEIKLAATKANVRATINAIASKIKKDDHLLIYVIDHGGTNDGKSNSFIWLWNGGQLYDYELAQMIDPICSKYVNVNVVLGQCYSGGFIDDLTKVGCVVSAASRGSEPSWACLDIPYDEFVYHWTSAVNGATHNQSQVNADADGNGRVTMLEAFCYARDHDRATKEHPMYVSTPISVGEDLAFNHLAPSVDLYIQDNFEDTGKEPNMTTNEFWKSPSIWIRNQNDSIYEHENPYYSPTHVNAYINVRIHNRGKEAFDGRGRWIHMYWAEASTDITDETWKGREYDENSQYPTGGVLDSYPIESIIEPGSYKDFVLPWTLPGSLKDKKKENSHFCLIAKIMDTIYDDGYVEDHTYFDLRGSNDHAQKNITIIKKDELYKAFCVYMRNPYQNERTFTLELVPQTAADAALYSIANVEMAMGDKVYNAWRRGGCVAQDVEVPSSHSSITSTNTVIFKSPQSKLQYISLKGKEFGEVKLKFDFLLCGQQSKYYCFDLIQKDESGNIMGGETFVVESPSQSFDPIVITQDPAVGGQVQLQVASSGFKSYKWTDAFGETISNKNAVTVTPSINGYQYAVAALTENGDLATQSISLENNFGIESANVSLGGITVKLRAEAPAKSTLSLTSAADGTKIASCNVPEGSSHAILDGARLEQGTYIIYYTIGGTLIDQKKISIR